MPHTSRGQKKTSHPVIKARNHKKPGNRADCNTNDNSVGQTLGKTAQGETTRPGIGNRLRLSQIRQKNYLDKASDI